MNHSGEENHVNHFVEGAWASTAATRSKRSSISLIPVGSDTVDVSADREHYLPQIIPSQKQSFSRSLFEKGDKELADARVAYAKKLGVGMLLVALEILAVFSIFWGSLWRVPAHLLSGWIVDFDGGIVGQFVVENLKAEQATTIAWEVVSSSRFQQGLDDLKKAVVDNGAWVAVVVNDGATARLSNSTANPDPAYNGEKAVTVYADEARNENAFRNLVRPSVEESMYAIKRDFAVQYMAQIIQRPNFASIAQTSPQTIVDPVSFTVVNLVPFSQPVATAALSTGLIFLLIMSNFIVTIASSARQASGIPRLLSLRSIIALRLGSSFVAYFFLSLIYTFVNRAFKLDMDHTYGHAGFFLFWAISWIYMLAVGLALESLLTVLKQYLSFFMTMWIVVNTSTNSNPLEVLPKVFHYGYAMPFYNFSKAVRTIVFGTRNTLGLNIGILLAWIMVSCVTLTGFQWSQRRRDINEMRKKVVKEPVPKPKETDDLAGEQKEKEEVVE